MSLEEKQSAEFAVEKTGRDDKVERGRAGDDSDVPTLTPAEEAKLWRKIDVRLMPMLTVMYLMSFMDRGNIGNAKLQGLETQLHLKGNQYNIALTMYFVSYCTLDCLANLVLKKFRPSRWLPGITIVWGIIMTSMGFVKTYQELVVVRVLLGIAEAGLFPGVCYYLSLWYPRHHLQYRIGVFEGAATVAGAFSGLLAFGISFMSGTGGLLGWSWIFIIEGLATVVVGLVALLVVVDFPNTAPFLTPEERAWLVHRNKYDNSSVGEAEHFQMRYFWEVITDWQIYLQILVYMSVVAPLYGIALFLPSIINGFGFSTVISQLLTVPPYVVGTVVIITFAAWSDRVKMRSPFIFAGLTMCLIGYCINISDAPRGAKYFGTFLIVAGAYAPLPGIVAWLGNNLAGQYKRGIGMAVQIGIGNFSGAFASNFYRAEDAPRYVLGHALELMFVGIGFIALPITVLTYKRINAKRDREVAEGAMKNLSEQDLRDMGDRAPDFRYTL